MSVSRTSPLYLCSLRAVARFPYFMDVTDWSKKRDRLRSPTPWCSVSSRARLIYCNMWGIDHYIGSTVWVLVLVNKLDGFGWGCFFCSCAFKIRYATHKIAVSVHIILCCRFNFLITCYSMARYSVVVEVGTIDYDHESGTVLVEPLSVWEGNRYLIRLIIPVRVLLHTLCMQYPGLIYSTVNRTPDNIQREYFTQIVCGIEVSYRIGLHMHLDSLLVCCIRETKSVRTIPCFANSQLVFLWSGVHC